MPCPEQFLAVYQITERRSNNYNQQMPALIDLQPEKSFHNLPGNIFALLAFPLKN
jgi:hypothetical protein